MSIKNKDMKTDKSNNIDVFWDDCIEDPVINNTLFKLSKAILMVVQINLKIKKKLIIKKQYLKNIDEI